MMVTAINLRLAVGVYTVPFFSATLIEPSACGERLLSS